MTGANIYTESVTSPWWKEYIEAKLKLTIFNKEQSIDKSRNLKDTVLVLGFFLSFHCSKFWRRFMELKVTISAVLCLC